MKTLKLTEGGIEYVSSDTTGTLGYWHSHERFVKQGTVRVINGKLSYCFLVHSGIIPGLTGTLWKAECVWGPFKP